MAQYNLQWRGLCGLHEEHSSEWYIAPKHITSSAHDLHKSGNNIFMFFSTPFTKVPRYSYSDRDYSYGPVEADARAKQKQKSSSFLRQKHSERLWNLKEK